MGTMGAYAGQLEPTNLLMQIHDLAIKQTLVGALLWSSINTLFDHS